MTLFNKTVEILEATIKEHREEPTDWLARRCLDELRKKRIVPHHLKASEEFFTRFQAHTRYMGDTAGPSYRYWYNKAVRHAMKMHLWPVRVVPAVIEKEPGKWEIVDLPTAASSTRATNAQIMCAYSVIQDGAKTHAVELPEGSHEQVRRGQA